MRLSELIAQDSIDAKLHMKIGLYRSYERDTTSGGGSTSGASSASSSASGGSSTPTSSTEAAHRHRMFDQGGGTALGLANKSISAWNEDTGAAVVLDMATGATFLDTRNAGGSHSHTVTIAGHTHDIAHTHTTPDHIHSQVYDIFEEGSLPGAVSVLVDGVNVDSVIGGPFTATTGNDTFDVSLTGIISAAGWHTLRFEAASGKGRITAYVIATTLQLQ